MFKIGGFLSTCNNAYFCCIDLFKNQILQNGIFKQTVEPITVYLFCPLEVPKSAALPRYCTHRGTYQHHDVFNIYIGIFMNLAYTAHLRQIITALIANCPHTYRRNVDECACLNLG